MFRFKAEQRSFKIGEVKVGGEPGRVPTVLIGSIFYHNQKLLLDGKKGEFNKEEAETLIKVQEEFSDRTGNPCMLDVIGSSVESIEKFLDFAAGVSDVPLLLDGTTAEVRVGGLRYAEEVGLLDRIIYNSIVPSYKREEIEAIEETGVQAAILLTFDTKEISTRGRVRTAKKLLGIARKIGIEKPLIDTCVLDVPTLGMACRAIYIIKDELGFPVGCGSHNAISTWKGLRKKMGRQAIKPAIVSASTMVASAGGDFVIYGPIEAAPYVFPTVAMVDAALGYYFLETKQGLERNHPLFRIP